MSPKLQRKFEAIDKRAAESAAEATRRAEQRAAESEYRWRRREKRVHYDETFGAGDSE